MTLARRFPGRPLVWVDDNPVSLNALDLPEIRSPRDRALTRSFWVTNPTRGITLEDVTQLDAWLVLASTPEGHEALRRLRRNQGRRTRRYVARRTHGTLARAARWKRAYQVALARLDERDIALATQLANGVRDNTFERAEFRGFIERWKQAPITPELEALLDAIDSHIRDEKGRP